MNTRTKKSPRTQFLYLFQLFTDVKWRHCPSTRVLYLRVTSLALLYPVLTSTLMAFSFWKCWCFVFAYLCLLTSAVCPTMSSLLSWNVNEEGAAWSFVPHGSALPPFPCDYTSKKQKEIIEFWEKGNKFRNCIHSAQPVITPQTNRLMNGNTEKNIYV